MVIPYDEFMRRLAHTDSLIPHEVVSATVDGASPMRAWREHLGLTQSEVASRLGVSQSAYARMEQTQRPRKTTVTRVARALGVTCEQLDF